MIRIDNREKSLIKVLNERLKSHSDKITMTVSQLDIGDVWIDAHDNSVVFERKTFQDLLSSIKDGRYEIGRAHV